MMKTTTVVIIIGTILSTVAHTDGCRESVDLGQPFLSVITHPARLDCLSVDTFVGDLFNYISGSNRARAIPIFKHLGTNLLEGTPNLPSLVW